MRKLVILRGSMGCGKSTWLKENDLEKYTLCADTMRLHLASPRMGINGKDGIPQVGNKTAWDMLFFFLEERMKDGEFTIIDAVHSKSSEFSRYKDLADKYRYRLYCVDFTDIPIEVAKQRNAQRPEYKQVPESEIDKVYSRFATQSKTSGFIMVKPDEFFDKVLINEPFDWNEYKNIHIFGDIHGCNTCLQQWFKENPFNEEDGYIFIGDYLDRGLENAETFKFIFELSQKPNVLLLTGNHENSIFDYSHDMVVHSKEFLNNTAIQLIEAGITKSDMRQLYRKLGVCAYITFRNKDFIISHGGIPYFPKQSIDFYAAIQFIKGVGSYEDNIDEIFDSWAKVENINRKTNGKNEIYQVHGHRNLLNIGFPDYEYSYNLEDKIEFGGNLRVLNLMNDGSFRTDIIKNEVFSQDLVDERDSAPDKIIHSRINSMGEFIQELRHSKHIQEKVLDDGISAFNFTRGAFDKGIWNNITTQARGLFIDTANEKIVARSYNKFFNKNEREETKFGSLVQNLKFPVRFFKKYNGFLAILTNRDGNPYVCSKTTNAGTHANRAKSVILSSLDESQQSALLSRLEKENLSAVFEIIDPINDPHIIKYSQEGAVLLDFVYNKIEFSRVPYEHLLAFGNRNNIQVKELCYTVNNLQEFLALNAEVEKPDYKYNGEYIEGFVVEDAEGFMFKYKLHYYTLWKSLRWVLNSYMNNPTGVNEILSSLTTPVENYFLGFLRNKYPNGNKAEDGNIIETNIIAERDDFLKNGGTEI